MLFESFKYFFGIDVLQNKQNPVNGWTNRKSEEKRQTCFSIAFIYLYIFNSYDETSTVTNLVFL